MLLDDKLAALETLSPAQLRLRAEREVGAMPAGYGPDLLRLALAFALQQRGGERLPLAVMREIAAVRRSGKGAGSALRIGTRLVREWNGRSHHVEVADGGFLYRDRRYRSLSAIANEITGGRWSGPRFFGLTREGRDAGAS